MSKAETSVVYSQLQLFLIPIVSTVLAAAVGVDHPLLYTGFLCSAIFGMLYVTFIGAYYDLYQNYERAMRRVDWLGRISFTLCMLCMFSLLYELVHQTADGYIRLLAAFTFLVACRVGFGFLADTKP